ncbi:MAG: hypothetical protein QOD00_2811 [Blastocatellia bacterium]|jgi:hypothetical protein|nr:hypothetical protein [Blastocatellia bacterium]
MTDSTRARALKACLLLSLLLLMSPQQTHARTLLPLPARDHLTEQEMDLVREAQALDKRTAVFIRAIERRLLVITDPTAAAASKQVQKETEKWGELPKGTRAELLSDIAKILDEAITNIDDVSERDDKNPLLPKSLRLLSAAATRFIPQLTPMRDQAKEEGERESLEQALESAQSIIEAANKLPPEVKTKGKNKS